MGEDPELLRRVARLRGRAPARIHYGPTANQEADLHLPAGDGPHPVCVLVHGGFWREPWSRRLMNGLAADLRDRGWAAWNIEYRRLGSRTGGWPGTFEDVAAAVDALVGVDAALDLARVAVAGHSAGGHLALWLAARTRHGATLPGGGPRVRVAAAVSLAGVADLAAAAAGGLGGGAAVELLGGTPDQVPERYRAASPAALLPTGVPMLLVHGERDGTVPVQQSAAFFAAARAAGDAADLKLVPATGHMEVIDPGHVSWREGVVPWLAASLRATPR